MYRGILLNQHVIMTLILLFGLNAKFVFSAELRDVVISDITPSGFSVLISGLEGSQVVLEVYDQNNHQIENIEVDYGYLSGIYHELKSNYQYSQYHAALTNKINEKELFRAKITGLKSNSVYLLRIKVTASDLEYYHPDSEFIEITTNSSSNFLNDALVYVIDVPQDIASDGAILYANVIGQSDYVSAVLGDGGRSGRAFISLANLNSFRSAGLNDQLPWGAIELTILEKNKTIRHNFERYFINSNVSVSTVQGLVLKDNSIATPPVIHIGSNSLSFNQFVESKYRLILSDVNGGMLELTLKDAPSGVSIEKIWDGRGSSIYEIIWMPQAGQLGSHLFSVIGSDGLLSQEISLKATVYPQKDIDSDGMDDGWELESFGSLDQDYFQDFDGDGYTNGEEFYNGWSPALTTHLPKALMNIQPIFGAKIKSRDSFLSVDNVEHSEDVSVNYVFELYSSEYLELLMNRTVSEGEGRTSMPLPEFLVENQIYHWRVRAIHKNLATNWVYGKIQLNQKAEAPIALNIEAPNNESHVSSSKPILSVYEAQDFDSDNLEYQFFLFDQAVDITSDLEPVVKIDSLVATADGNVSWQVPVELSNGVKYFWYALAIDSDNHKVYTDVNSFIVDSDMASAPNVKLTYPLNSIDIDGDSVSFQWERPKGHLTQSFQYQLEVSSSDQFSVILYRADVESSESLETLNWKGELTENQKYFWRLRTVAGDSLGSWSSSSFIYNDINEPPSDPFITYPGNNEVVYENYFRIGVREARDDSELLTYEYEIFNESDINNPIISVDTTDQNWQSPILEEGDYLWKVRSLDSGGLYSNWTDFHKVKLVPGNYQNIQEFKFTSLPLSSSLDNDLMIIQWVDYDLSAASKLQLYYISPQGSEILLSNNIDVFLDQENDFFRWNVSGLVPGSYRLKAVLVNDESSYTVFSDTEVVLQKAPAQAIRFKLMTPNLVDEFGEKIVEIQAFSTQPIKAAFDIPLSVEGKELEIHEIIFDGEVIENNTLHFSPNNWQKPYSIKIIGLDDCIVDGNKTEYLFIHESIPLNENVERFNASDIEIVNEDNEKQGQELFICSSEISTTGENMYEVTANVENRGDDQFDIVGHVVAVSDSFKINSDASVIFPDIKSGQVVSNKSPIKISVVNGGFEARKLSWTFTSRAASSDLSILLEGSDGKWKKGKFTAKSIVKNLGTETARQLQMEILTPDKINNYSFSDSNCIYRHPNINCKRDSLSVGEDWIVSITANTDDSKTEFEFTGRINGQNNDPNMNNNISVEKFGGAFSLWWLLVCLSASSLLRLRKSH